MKKDVPVAMLLKISIALMFIAAGLVGITHYQSDVSQFSRSVGKLFGAQNDVMPILFSVFQLVAGVILLLTLFVKMPPNFISISILVIFIVWAVSIAVNYFIDGFMRPDFIRWLANVSPQLVILSALWILFKSHE